MYKCKKAVSKFGFQDKKNYIPFNSLTYESSCWRTIAIITIKTYQLGSKVVVDYDKLVTQ